MLLTTKLPNAELVLVQLIRSINPAITQTSIVDELNIHPDYPSLLALNDVLNNYGINSAAYRISPDELFDVPCPFIAHSPKKGQEFLLVKKLTADTVTVSGISKKDIQMPLVEFKNILDGVVLVPEEVNNIKYANASMYDDVAQWFSAAVLIILLICLLILNKELFNIWRVIATILVKSCGLAVSVMLLIQSIDKKNPLIQAICSGKGKGKVNCNSILSSDAANVFEGLSWSEVGFFYFAGTWLTLLMSGANQAVVHILALANVCSLPYTIYSIYYQARVAKQWCVFCCTVQALLWLEFILLSKVLKEPATWPDGRHLLIMFLSLLLPVATWLFLKPLLIKAQQLKPLKSQLQRFKYNIETFNASLKNQPKYMQPDHDWSITLGNVEASNVITMVSNPYCEPCSQTHEILDDWLDKNPDIQARIVFAAENIDNDLKTTVVRHLMALAQLHDRTIIKQALHDWYKQKQKNYESWAKKYPVILNNDQNRKLDNQINWCRMAEITSTPTLLLNGYRIPVAYRLNDLKYMLE
ncbi:thioredoxin domain-containing protein [Mucilaginibacter rubeus]|uniref:Thioredoxin domain-containing protein n=1 Tax=Mucilaginibacter rubeus TaxID=2027860 RepID=A0AAE6MKR5_9SPHI|nr:MULTISPECIES: vitamin K epoxide reductase family protein [Mucilaginibacter]QEM06502.1 thioredoxin domain-containing protein [Mucilaginibacter rubeus]QEM19090.1 thioredoxin domain-containing protein [Mucilaginibacter gossypii]QTE44367.1 thioredoxin domain-containing protein [Mucilaginibacter rubeus]QTE50967.1 thioredoxin domain-containing protein [Mucilaginibacter rubeus]QTE56050.1 thioredoxin domain-containing protein [Mucilaginibacter rubeus]